jgi:hypothetical protein
MAVSCAKTRETAKAVTNADVAATAITKLASSKDITSYLASLSDTERKKMLDIINKIIKISQTINYGLKPAIVELSQGENIQPTVTVDEAIEQTDTFVSKSMLQAGKSAAEVEHNNDNRGFVSGLLDIGSSILDGSTTIAGLLTGTGTLGLIVAGLLKRLGTYKKSLDDQIEYAKDMKQVPPDISEEDLVKIQEKHARKQQANGTHGVINAALKRKKP